MMHRKERIEGSPLLQILSTLPRAFQPRQVISKVSLPFLNHSFNQGLSVKCTRLFIWSYSGDLLASYQLYRFPQLLFFCAALVRPHPNPFWDTATCFNRNSLLIMNHEHVHPIHFHSVIRMVHIQLLVFSLITWFFQNEIQDSYIWTGLAAHCPTFNNY